MRYRRRAVVAAVWLVAHTAAAQGHDHAPDAAVRTTASSPEGVAFLARAVAATARYQVLDSAIADGFRQVGAETPGMGEHWVDVGRVLRDGLQPGEPPILIYARVHGTPVLVGLAFTQLLAPDADYPALPVGRAAWHDHNGSVDEEILPLSHLPQRGRSSRIRLAVMHAWVWADNPDGVCAPDNWTLPFRRLGLRPNARGDRLARTARVLSLADGTGYLPRVVLSSAHPSDAESALLRQIFRESADSVRAVVEDAPDSLLDAVDVARLDRTWAAMWDRIDHVLAPDALRRLRPLAELWR